jgi:hypothetical protein
MGDLMKRVDLRIDERKTTRNGEEVTEEHLVITGMEVVNEGIGVIVLRERKD